MTDQDGSGTDGDDDASGESRAPDAAPRRGVLRRSTPGCLAALLALAVLVGLFYFGITRGVDALTDRFAPAPDYPGPGSGEVTVRVSEGQTLAEIGRALQEQDVVKSVEAFTEATRAEPESTSIQVGVYQLRQQMAAEDALEVLVDPANIVATAVTVPEGLRLTDILDVLAEHTDHSREQFERALDAGIGLPPSAGGEAEGYLFPATYEFDPDAGPGQMLRTMVQRWRRAAQKVGLAAAAERLGYTQHELMTVASLAQSEVKTPEDMAKVARVVYNRIENPGVEETGGLLQIDATVDYALGRELTVGLTQEERETTDSPYNTFREPGLPPGPISSPGAGALRAATSPAEGDWYFYVTVDLGTGETKFAETYDEFVRYRDQLREYCDTESEAC